MPELKRYIDYYPFGSLMPGRNSNSGDYAYGFQGQLMDNEIKGTGNSINFEYRMHDPRLGRFLSIDPLADKYPMLTPYQFSSNSPLGMLEIEGLEGKPIFRIFNWYFYLRKHTARTGEWFPFHIEHRNKIPEKIDIENEKSVAEINDIPEPKLKKITSKTITKTVIKDSEPLKKRHSGIGESAVIEYDIPQDGGEYEVKFDPYQISDEIEVFDNETGKKIISTSSKGTYKIPSGVKSIKITIGVDEFNSEYELIVRSTTKTKETTIINKIKKEGERKVVTKTKKTEQVDGNTQKDKTKEVKVETYNE